jgi:hypothetical protein
MNDTMSQELSVSISLAIDKEVSYANFIYSWKIPVLQSGI